MSLPSLSTLITSLSLLYNSVINIVIASSLPTIVVTTIFVFLFLIFVSITVPRMKLETLSHIAWINGLSVLGGFLVAQIIIFFLF